MRTIVFATTFAVLLVVACAAGWAEIRGPVGAALGQRDDVVNLLPGIAAHPTAAAPHRNPSGQLFLSDRAAGMLTPSLGVSSGLPELLRVLASPAPLSDHIPLLIALSPLPSALKHASVVHRIEQVIPDPFTIEFSMLAVPFPVGSPLFFLVLVIVAFALGALSIHILDAARLSIRRQARPAPRWPRLTREVVYRLDLMAAAAFPHGYMIPNYKGGK